MKNIENMKKFLPIIILILIITAGYLVYRELNKKPAIPVSNNPAQTTNPTSPSKPAAISPYGQKIKKGQKLAVLGAGYSHETDGERRHLHFGVLSNYRIDTRGYVQVKSELSGWLNPLILYY